MNGQAAREPRAVIVGAGFGGLRAARALRDSAVEIMIVDQRNYHLFVPLLYQVATAGLEGEAIAQPVRRILHNSPNVRFRMAAVTGIDLERRALRTAAGDHIAYDFLVLAGGSTTNFFGLDSVANVSSALRTLDDAEELRDRVLNALERAASEPDQDRRRELMTVVIVGGGPTGVELAGALAELRRHVLPRDYPDLDMSQARILLLEAASRLLPGFAERSQGNALEKLRQMRVEVRLEAAVADADERGVTLRDGERIGAGAVIWVAGMRAPSLADLVDTPKGASGRVIVDEALQLPGHREVYVIGDMAHVNGPEARPHPMMAPVAIQQGELAAENIRRATEGKPPRRFRYRSRGVMATIGRRAAVAEVLGLQFSGFIAWVLWLTVHLVWLIGFRNRLVVLVNWAWNYFTYDRGARIIRGRS